jgi:hypothetical protein
MPKKSATQILAAFFNSDPETKKPLREFAEELKSLTPEDKHELATLAAPLVGAELSE